MVMEATPDRARARATARAEPPAPTISALLPRGANPASPSSARIKPIPSVLCPDKGAPVLVDGVDGARVGGPAVDLIQVRYYRLLVGGPSR